LICRCYQDSNKNTNNSSKPHHIDNPIAPAKETNNPGKLAEVSREDRTS